MLYLVNDFNWLQDCVQQVLHVKTIGLSQMRAIRDKHLDQCPSEVAAENPLVGYAFDPLGEIDVPSKMIFNKPLVNLKPHDELMMALRPSRDPQVQRLFSHVIVGLPEDGSVAHYISRVQAGQDVDAVEYQLDMLERRLERIKEFALANPSTIPKVRKMLIELTKQLDPPATT